MSDGLTSETPSRQIELEQKLCTHYLAKNQLLKLMTQLLNAEMDLTFLEEETTTSINV